MAGRDPEPCRARDAGIDPRGRRARLFAGACLWRGVRQSGPAGRVRGRRRRGGDGCAGGELALEQVPQPARDGAVLPILHLNGFKIANPTILARIDGHELDALLRGYGLEPYYVGGGDPAAVHQQLAAALDKALAKIQAIQAAARVPGATAARPRWPMIVFRTPKGWTGPKVVDGKPVEGAWRAHQGADRGLQEP
ncbi:hypothetical protein QP162_05785 [Sphingomonas aurantiaca]